MGNAVDKKLKTLLKECEDFLGGNENQVAKPRIAAWGLVKAGKSSLLNMLSDNVTDEYFETGSIPTTHTNRELEAEQYILIDTPGLGINDDDTQEAYKGLDSADVILFVHAPPGELDLEEVRLLDRIHAEYGNQAEQRLIIVITKLDENRDHAVEKIRDKVLDQVEQRIGLKPHCFLLSNTRYQKGAVEHKNTLIKNSGMPVLARYLSALVTEIQPDLSSVRAERSFAKQNSLLERLDKEIELETTAILDIRQLYEKKITTFNCLMQRLYDEYKNTEAEISDAKSKLMKL